MQRHAAVSNPVCSKPYMLGAVDVEPFLLMNFRFATLFVSIVFCHIALGQNRIITGKVIDQEFQPMGRLASVRTTDTVRLVDTDSNGMFKVSIPDDVQVLLVAAIGMEWRRIELAKDCSYLEVVLMYRPTYCFDPPGKVYRMRKKEFEKLAGLHQLAFQKGIFQSEKPCFIENYISRKEFFRGMISELPTVLPAPNTGCSKTQTLAVRLSPTLK